MDYIITFEDGDTAYLEHHGVKGMHWGVRNAETQAKYAGRGGRARRRQDIRDVSRRTANATNKAAVDYLNRYNNITSAKKSGTITKDQYKKQIAKNADDYERKFYAERAKGRTEKAKIKAEGKSDKAKARIMSKAAAKNTYEKENSKGYSYARHQSKGKEVVKAALLGYSGGTQSYNSARAAGKSRVKSLGYAVVGDVSLGNSYAQSQANKVKKATKAKYRK